MKIHPRVIKSRSDRYLLRFSSFQPAIIIDRKDVDLANEVCELFPPGTPNRTKLIKAELRKRGIIK